VWTHRGHELARVSPDRVDCDGDGIVYRSTFPAEDMPKNPAGVWSCETFTAGGQLVGLRKFEVLTKEGKSIEELGSGAGSSGSAGSAGSAH
jgi:hypothetical protein